MTAEAGNEPQVALPESGRGSGVPVYWWHWVIGVALVASLTYLSPRGKSPEFAYLTKGSISQDKIIAPFDFEVLKSEGELEKERREAKARIHPVLTAVDTVREFYRKELLNFAQESKSIISTFPPSVLKAAEHEPANISLEDSSFFIRGGDRLFNRFGVRLTSGTWRFLIRLYNLDQRNHPGQYTHFFQKPLTTALFDVYNQGIIDVPRASLIHSSDSVMIQYANEESTTDLKKLLTKEEAISRIRSLLPVMLKGMRLPQGAVRAANDILKTFIAPNIIYNRAETENRLNAAYNKVPLVKGFVKKDELIIGANIKVNQEHIDKLNSLAKKRMDLEEESGGARALILLTAGQFVLVLLIVGLFFLFIALVLTDIWRQWKMMLLVALIIGLVHLFQALVPVKYDLPRYMFPAAVGAMLLAILVDRGVALMGIVTMALLAGLIRGNDFPVAFSAVIIGGTALFAVQKVQTRSDVMRTAIYLIVIYIPLVAAFHFVHFTTGLPLIADMAVATATSILSPTLVLGLVIICEGVFDITTDLSLLELVDLNRPLLRELALKSPGTYHHSIMVGSLAENAAREIGANALLTRAGAYYHDIGKMENREYFIENQEAGSRNIHDRLAPEKSAEMVIAHVQRGLELAEKYRLPKQIKQFISEHHGRSRLAFFYAKAVKEKGEDVDEASYRYPGPNPQSKETGILMLADTVEAATRSMDDHSPEGIRNTIDSLIRSRLSNGDLDECPLTLKEIGTINNVFMRVLTGIYHQRIQYPQQNADRDDDEREDDDAGEEETTDRG